MMRNIRVQFLTQSDMEKLLFRLEPQQKCELHKDNSSVSMAMMVKLLKDKEGDELF